MGGKINSAMGESMGNKGSALEIKITDPLILLRLNKRSPEDDVENMAGMQLYERARCCWRVNLNSAQRAKFALAVFRGIVLEVYVIEKWRHPADTRPPRHPADKERWEFTGKIADESVRGRFIGRYVPLRGSNPVKYVNC